MDELRRATRSVHERVDVLPFHRAFFGGELSLRSHAGFLKAMGVVNDVLETGAAGSDDLRAWVAPVEAVLAPSRSTREAPGG